MKRLFRTVLMLVLFGTACTFQAFAQRSVSLLAGPRTLMAKYAFYSPDGSHLLVTLCQYAVGQGPTRISCRPWRYHLMDRRWEKVALTPDNPNWSIDSATYSPDGKTIAATIVTCTPVEPEKYPQCPYQDYRLLLIDATTGKHRTIASENARFEPGFTPDGRGLVYWQLDNLQGVATGTTPYPARQAQTLYATHNIHTLSLSDEQGRLAIKVRAQVPLAPPRVFPDGVRVTIAGRGVKGAVTTKIGLYEGLWGVTNALEADDSFLIGDLQTGSMFSALPRRYPMRVIFDVRQLAGTKTQQIIYSQDSFHVHVSDPDAQNAIKVSPEFGAKNRGYGLPVKHAAFAPSGDFYVYVLGGDLAITPLRPSDEFEIIERPTFIPISTPNN